MTARIRYRWLLPVGHTLIDLLLLGIWISYGLTLLRNEKSRVVERPVGPSIVLAAGQ